MAVRLFVGNLPYSATEAVLREHFSVIGPLSYIYLPVDRETGKPRGFAFVEFNDRAQAEAAIQRFNNQPFMGRPIAVSEARERDERPRQASHSSSPVSSWQPSEPPDPKERPTRNFGPDATPRRTRKAGKGGSRSERAPKQPIRQRPGGQFFGGDDDESYDDDSSDENFASRVNDPQDE